MSRLSKEQVEQYLTIIGENSYPAEAAELRWHIEALQSELYSQWERGYGDGITGMGAVLAGAPLENLPEANREQARRWIDRHDAEVRSATVQTLASAIKKVCPEVIPAIVSAANPEEEFIKFLREDRAAASPVAQQAGAPEREQP